DLGDGAYRGTRVVGRRLLVDRDGGGEAIDVVDVGLFHEAQELASVGGERLDVAALAFSVDGVEGEGGLPGTREAGNDDELVARDSHFDVLEVVFAGAANMDVVTRHRRIPFAEMGRVQRMRGKSWSQQRGQGSVSRV